MLTYPVNVLYLRNQSSVVKHLGCLLSFTLRAHTVTSQEASCTSKGIYIEYISEVSFLVK